MIRYILVDDNPKTLTSVKDKIDGIAKDFDLQYIASYNNSKTAYQTVNTNDFDLLIVDFDMPVYNGLELTQKIGVNKKVIFLTSTTQNEQKVINSLDIAGYLSKPFDIDEFKNILKNKVIDKSLKKSSTSNTSPITLKIGVHKDIRFFPEQVYYITTSKNINGEQSDKNHVHFYGKNDQLLIKNVYISIKNLIKDLKPYQFEKINQSTIINLSHLKERDNTNISLYNTLEPFQISSKEKLDFVSKLRTKFGI